MNFLEFLELLQEFDCLSLEAQSALASVANGELTTASLNSDASIVEAYNFALFMRGKIENAIPLVETIEQLGAFTGAIPRRVVE